MATRGPKPKTAKNSRRKAPTTIKIDQVEPTSALAADALKEFYRLVGVLDRLRILERVDLSVVTEAARTKELLDRAYRLHEQTIDPKNVSVVTQLTSRHQGLIRMLGLSVQPSRSVVKTVAKNSTKNEDQSAVSSYLKLKA